MEVGTGRNAVCVLTAEGPWRGRVDGDVCVWWGGAVCSRRRRRRARRARPMSPPRKPTSVSCPYCVMPLMRGTRLATAGTLCLLRVTKHAQRWWPVPATSSASSRRRRRCTTSPSPRSVRDDDISNAQSDERCDTPPVGLVVRWTVAGEGSFDLLAFPVAQQTALLPVQTPTEPPATANGHRRRRHCRRHRASSTAGAGSVVEDFYSRGASSIAELTALRCAGARVNQSINSLCRKRVGLVSYLCCVCSVNRVQCDPPAWCTQ